MIKKIKFAILVLLCFSFQTEAQTSTALKFNYGYFPSHSDGFFSEAYVGLGLRRNIYEHLSIGLDANFGWGSISAAAGEEGERTEYRVGDITTSYYAIVNHPSFMISYNSRFYTHSDNNGFYIASNITYKSVTENLTFSDYNQYNNVTGDSYYLGNVEIKNEYTLFPIGISLGLSGSNDWYSDLSFGVYYNLGDVSTSGKGNSYGNVKSESLVNTFSFQLNYSLGIRL